MSETSEASDPHSIEDLLGQTAWVRTLARRLVADPGEADDLTQEAWLVALRKPPAKRSGPVEEDSSAVRAWFGQVVRNLAITRARGRSRRRDREAGLSVEGDEVASDELVGQLELQERLSRFVRELPERERRACLAKYYEGRSVRSIAEELGTSESGVRGLLARGRERLAERLDRESEGGREYWMSSLAGLASLDMPARRGGLVALAPSALGILAAGLVVFFGWVGISGSNPSDVPRVAVSGNSEPPSSSAEDASQVVASPTSERRSVAKPAPATYVVLVQHNKHHPRAGKPVVGVEVQITRAEAEALALNTDSEGRVEFVLEDLSELRKIYVLAGLDTTCASIYANWQPAPGASSERVIQVGPGATLRGRVVDLEGRAIAGAEVGAWCCNFSGYIGGIPPTRATTSAADGSFELQPIGNQFLIEARCEGYSLEKTLSGELLDNSAVEGLEVVLAPVQTLHGRVVDQESKEPIEGIEVWIGERWRQLGYPSDVAGVKIGQPQGFAVTSDVNGEFVASGVGGFTGVRCGGGGRYLSADARVSEGEYGRPLEIQLDPGSSLHGRVFLADGTPAKQAKVSLNRLSSTTTNELGAFEFHGLEKSESPPSPDGGFLGLGDWLSGRRGEATGFLNIEDAQYLVAHSEAGAVTWKPVRIEAGSNSVDLRLDPPHEIRGRVLNADGAPVVNCRVRVTGDRIGKVPVVYGQPTTWEFLGNLSERKTDENGEFHFDRLYPGSFDVQAFLPNTVNQFVRTECASSPKGTSAPIALRLDPTESRRVAFTGRVTDALTGEPLTSFKLSPMLPSPSTSDGFSDAGGFSLTIEDLQGEFDLPGSQPGRMYLACSSPGYRSWSSGTRQFREGDHDFQIALWPERTLRLSALDLSGEPLQGAVALLFDPEGKRLDYTRALGGTVNLVSLPSRELRGLPATTITIELHSDEFAEPQRAVVDLTEPGPHEYEFRVAREVERRHVEVGTHLLTVLGATPRLVRSREDVLAERGSWLPLDAQKYSIEVQEQGQPLAREQGERNDQGLWSIWGTTGPGSGHSTENSPEPGSWLAFDTTATSVQLLIEVDDREYELTLNLDDPELKMLILGIPAE